MQSSPSPSEPARVCASPFRPSLRRGKRKVENGMRDAKRTAPLPSFGGALVGQRFTLRKSMCLPAVARREIWICVAVTCACWQDVHGFHH